MSSEYSPYSHSNPGAPEVMSLARTLEEAEYVLCVMLISGEPCETPSIEYRRI